MTKRSTAKTILPWGDIQPLLILSVIGVGIYVVMQGLSDYSRLLAGQPHRSWICEVFSIGCPPATDGGVDIVSPTDAHGCKTNYQKWCPGENKCKDVAVGCMLPEVKDSHGCKISGGGLGYYEKWCETLRKCMLVYEPCPEPTPPPVIEVPPPVPDPTCNEIGWACRNRGCCTQQEHDAYHARCLAPNQINVFAICGG